MWARIWWATSSTGSSTTASPRLGRLPRPPLSPPCPRYCRISAFRPPPARSPTTSASTPLHDGIHDHRHQVLPSGQLDEHVHGHALVVSGTKLARPAGRRRRPLL